MKKSLLILGLIFALILNQIFITAIDYSNEQDPLGLGFTPDTMPQTPEEMKNASTNYLNQEFNKILENSAIMGPLISGYGKISPYTNPIFEYTLGMKPTLSWLFVLTLVLWICFVTYMLRLLSITSLFSKWVQVIISFGVVIIISVTGITRKLAQEILDKLSLLNTWWMQLIGVVIVIFMIILASVFSEEIEKLIKKIKEKKAKNEEEINRKKLKSGVEVVEEIEKGLK
jgi:hypothetical protein